LAHGISLKHAESEERATKIFSCWVFTRDISFEGGLFRFFIVNPSKITNFLPAREKLLNPNCVSKRKGEMALPEHLPRRRDEVKIFATTQSVARANVRLGH
jgi:hypothetical protein